MSTTPGLTTFALAVSDLAPGGPGSGGWRTTGCRTRRSLASGAGHHQPPGAGDIAIELRVLDPAFLAALGVDGSAAGTHEVRRTRLHPARPGGRSGGRESAVVAVRTEETL